MDKKTQSAQPAQRRRLTATVVSAKMEKTAVVRVDRVAMHPKYHKQYSISTKFKADNPENRFTAGQQVIIEETRPLSRDKRWRIVKTVTE